MPITTLSRTYQFLVCVLANIENRWRFSSTCKVPWRSAPWCYVVASAVVAMMTALIFLTHADASIVNIPPLYVLAVQLVAVLVGSRPAVFASVCAFFAFDWFFVEPRYQLTVRDPFEFVALCVFLVSAILVGQLTVLFQTRASEARSRERVATALAKASWTVASDLNRDSALRKVLHEFESASTVNYAEIFTVTGEDGLVGVCAYHRADVPFVRPQSFNKAINFVRETRQTIGWQHGPHWDKALDLESGHHCIYLPISTEGQMFGILFLQTSKNQELSEDERKVIASLLNHIAVVLQRDKLLETRAKAQGLAEANRLKTALLQMVSHDFRSPLASIKASVTSMLAEEGLPVDKHTEKALLQAIEDEADRLNRMVGNLLDLSRLEANAWQPQREPCMLSELIGATLDSFSAQDNDRICVCIESISCEIFVDFVQMVQALKNLVENALKYSSSDSTVEVRASHDNGDILFEILDRGPGLPVGEASRVFEPFFRGKQHQESSLPGVGMGLAVCKGLIEAHEGNLTAYNRENGGAVFCARLPQNMVIPK